MNWAVVALLVIAGAFVVFVAVVVPAVIQLRNTLAATEVFIKNMDASLKPLIEDEIRPMVRSFKSAAAGIEVTVNAVAEVGGTVSSINRIIKDNIRGPLINIAASFLGVKVGAAALVQSLMSLKQKSMQKEVE
jgi:uncharacterized protein YoxC